MPEGAKTNIFIVYGPQQTMKQTFRAIGGFNPNMNVMLKSCLFF